MDIETTAEILIKNCTCLAEAKSHGLTHMLIHEATQTGKCWDEIKGILRLKICNTKIHTYTSCFMEIQQKDNKTLAAYIHGFKQQLSDVLLTMTLQQSIFMLRDFEMHSPLQQKYMERTLKLWMKSSDWLRNLMQDAT